jgi:hypothetical protein
MLPCNIAAGRRFNGCSYFVKRELTLLLYGSVLYHCPHATFDPRCVCVCAAVVMSAAAGAGAACLSGPPAHHTGCCHTCDITDHILHIVKLYLCMYCCCCVCFSRGWCCLPHWLASASHAGLPHAALPSSAAQQQLKNWRATGTQCLPSEQLAWFFCRVLLGVHARRAGAPNVCGSLVMQTVIKTIWVALR